MKVMAFIILLANNIGAAHANTIDNLVSKPMQVGETSRMTYLFWDVYDATLFAPNGNYSADSPFVLKLTYLRDLAGDDIAQRSIEEMRKQGFTDEKKLALWLTNMKRIFPNVNEGTQLLGVRNKAGGSVFYSDNKLLGEITDPGFTKHFFDIWLSEKTSEPEMRKELLAIEDKS
ncbi:chalcone isomerase family protein [Pseudoalteromonas aurantia]|uniref:Chalcone isomerase domain-containing protein n=1 Tax=Pseudoalteromonas aurantia TaxID=43654 RepID=A0ABY2VVR4_9GAMM|nr:chalcone isomerase family protein [Pseudoalteromonas aurantia]TMO73135.1 hypothetical protein CWC20_13805 [Pseudoalteromonas aurantia]